MTRENAAEKARRYLAEGRLVVTAVDGDHLTATCRGGGAVYELDHRPGRGWSCTCPARTDRCAHLHALQLVVAVAADRSPWGRGAVPPPEEPPPDDEPPHARFTVGIR